MIAHMRVEEIVASLREDATDTTIADGERGPLLALADLVAQFATPEEHAQRIVDEEAENHGVTAEEMRPNGRGRRAVTRARYAAVRRLGALGLSTRRIAGLLGYHHHGPVALIISRQREWRP